MKNTQPIPNLIRRPASEILYLKKAVDLLDYAFPAVLAGETKFFAWYWAVSNCWDISCVDYRVWQHKKFKDLIVEIKETIPEDIKVYFSCTPTLAADIQLRNRKKSLTIKTVVINGNKKVFQEPNYASPEFNAKFKIRC